MEQNTVQNNQKLKHRMPKNKRIKIPYILGVVFAVVLVVSAGAFIFARNYESNRINQLNKVNDFCTEQAKEASKYFQAGKEEQLKEFQQKIEKEKNFEKSPNCLAVLVVYYANIYDIVNSDKYINKLENLKITDKNLPEFFANYGLANVAELKNFIEVKKVQNEQNKANVYYY